MRYYGRFYWSALYPSWRVSTPTLCDGSVTRTNNSKGVRQVPPVSGGDHCQTPPHVHALDVGPHRLVTRVTRARWRETVTPGAGGVGRGKSSPLPQPALVTLCR